MPTADREALGVGVNVCCVDNGVCTTRDGARACGEGRQAIRMTSAKKRQSRLSLDVTSRLRSRQIALHAHKNVWQISPRSANIAATQHPP